MTDDELRLQYQELKSYLLDFRTAVIQRLADIDGRLDTLAGTVNSIDSRMPVLTRAVTGIESRMYLIPAGRDPRDTKLIELEDRIRKLEGAA